MNHMITFNQQKLLADLQRLPPRLRVAFAAACAERQLPAYLSFLRESHAEEQNALVRALDDVWVNSSNDEEMALQQQLKECMELIPQEDAVSGCTGKASHAQEAGISIVYALRTRISGKAEEAAWSAQTAYEILDNFVINQDEIDPNQPGSESRVLSHPLVQAELLRQQRDLDELRNMGDANHQHVVMRIRDRAKADKPIFFGRGS